MNLGEYLIIMENFGEFRRILENPKELEGNNVI